MKYKKSMIVGAFVVLLGLLGPRGVDIFLRSTDMGHHIVETLSNHGIVKTPPPTRPAYILALYQLMKDVHDVLEACHIDYWIEGGTLLGAVRHHGIIPWDDDLDVQIRDEDRERFSKEAAPVFKALGYSVGNRPGKDCGFQVQMGPKHLHLLPHEVPPPADIYAAKEKIPGEVCICTCSKGIKFTDLFPLKKVPFGALHVWAPANPIPYLTALYGKNWATMAKRGVDHLHEKGHKQSSRTYVILRTFVPAEPFGPLVDHRKDIKAMRLNKEVSSTSSNETRSK
jgi:lipopolysaccharide cholinephosphotransferase